MADVGVDTTQRIIDDLQKKLARKELKDIEALQHGLRNALCEILRPVEKPLTIEQPDGPYVILMVGVNGAGKTTTIGKLARRFKEQGFSVMLAAGDTFRAAAVEQLQAWGDRNDVPVIAQHPGADPAAVIFDAMDAARARDVDILLADTAGRLQSQTGLMDEHSKVKRVISRRDATAQHEIMLVLDASQGQNAFVQAEKFNEALGLTGLTVTKLDGSAKGGILLGIADRIGVPVRFIGIGEAAEDMQPFSAEEFVDALLASGHQGSDRELMIPLENVTKRFPGGQEALSGLSLAVDKGEMVFVTGHSGAGKRTLLRLIALIERPTSGQVIVDGQNTRRVKRRRIPKYRRQIGMVFQDHKLLYDRPVFDNVALPLIIAGVGHRDAGRRVRAALDQVSLLHKEKQKPETLSAGEQQRVGIARAIVTRPKLLIADEPTGNLDPDLSLEVMRIFRRFNEVGVTLLIASHDISLIDRLGCRRIALEDGRLQENEEVDEWL